MAVPGDGDMFDWTLLWRLALLVVLAAVVAAPAQVRAVAAARGAPAPHWTSSVVLTAVVAVVGLLAAVVGTAAAAHIGLQTPVLRPAAGSQILPTLARHLGWGALGGVLVAAVILPFYYGVMRPLFEPGAFSRVETARRGMGLPGVIALGGVLEEVVFRWAVVALIAWVGLKVTGGVGPGVQWAAILGAALLFGLVHLPGAAGLGVRMGPTLIVAGLATNGLLGIVAGWLVWHRGLVAAIAVHATVHIVWYVVEPATTP